MPRPLLHSLLFISHALTPFRLHRTTSDHAAQLGRLSDNVSSAHDLVAELHSADLDVQEQLAFLQSATQLLEEDVLTRLSGVDSELGALAATDDELQMGIDAVEDSSERQSAAFEEHLARLRRNVTLLQEQSAQAALFSDDLFAALEVARSNFSSFEEEQSSRTDTAFAALGSLATESATLWANLTSMEAQCLRRTTAINDSVTDAIAAQSVSVRDNLAAIETNISRLGVTCQERAADLDARVNRVVGNVSSLAGAGFVVRDDVANLRDNVTWMRSIVTSLQAANRSQAEQAQGVRRDVSLLAASVGELEGNVSGLHSAFEQCISAREELVANNSAQARQIRSLSAAVADLSDTVARMQTMIASLTTAAHFVPASSDTPSESPARTSAPTTALDASLPGGCDDCRTSAPTSLAPPPTATTRPADPVSATSLPASSVSPTTQLTFSILPADIFVRDGEDSVDVLQEVCDDFLQNACTDVHASNNTEAAACSGEATASLPSGAWLVLSQEATTEATVNLDAGSELQSCDLSGAEASTNFTALLAAAMGVDDPVCPAQVQVMFGSTCGAGDVQVSFGAVGVDVIANPEENVRCTTQEKSNVSVSVSFHGGWTPNETRRVVTDSLGLSAANLLLANGSLNASNIVDFKDETRISIEVFVPSNGLVDWDAIAITDVVSILRTLQVAPAPGPAPSTVVSTTERVASLTSASPLHSNRPDDVVVAVGSSVGVVALIATVSLVVVVLLGRRRRSVVNQKAAAEVQPRVSSLNTHKPQRSEVHRTLPPSSSSRARRALRRKVIPGVTWSNASKKKVNDLHVGTGSDFQKKLRAKRERARRRRDRSWTREAQEDLQRPTKETGATGGDNLEVGRQPAAASTTTTSTLVVSARLHQKILARRKRMSPARSTSASAKAEAVTTDGGHTDQHQRTGDTQINTATLPPRDHGDVRESSSTTTAGGADLVRLSEHQAAGL